jgi:hypothetical protein
MAVFYFYAHASMQFQTSGSIVPQKKKTSGSISCACVHERQYLELKIQYI